MAGRDLHIYHAANEDSIDQLLKLADWLSSKNYLLYHNDTIARRSPGTGVWFLNSTEYQLWRSSTGSTLWVTGMPGAGKTFLAAIVVEDLRSVTGPETNKATVFAYCRYMDKCTAREILCTFLKQLVQANPQVYHMLRPLFDAHRTRQTRLTEGETVEQLTLAIGLFSEVVAVIDGLDEISEEEKERLLEILSTLPVKVIIFSRPPELVTLLESPTSLVSIEASNEDIEMFVLERVRDSPRLRKFLKQKDSLEQLVTARIKEKSGGMFLVAALQVESLKRCMNLKALLSTLDSLPSGVDDMYKRTLARIDDQLEEESSLAKLALLWLAHAQRALKMDELQDALAVSLEDMTYDADAITPSEIILSVCCGLVVVDPSSNEARLVHYTAQEYIRKNKLPPFVNHPSIMTLTCTTYLTHHGYCEQDLETFDALETFLESGPSSFLRYAQTFWIAHAKWLSENSSHDALAKTRNFLSKCKNVVYAFPTLQYFNFPFRLNAEHEILNPCHVAARFGLTKLYPSVKHHDNQPTLRYRWTALHLASLMNQLDMLELILSESPSLNINIQDKGGRSALHQAVQEGHESIVARLLAHPRINVNLKDSYRSAPLCVAAEERNTGILSLLLGHPSIEVNTPDRHGEWPLLQSLLDGAPSVAECLLKHPSLKINLDNGKESALQVAVRRHYTIVVKRMVSRRDLDINWANRRGDTALHTAVRFVKELDANPTLPLLLERNDISLSVKDALGCTPLLVAVHNDHYDTARLLVDHSGNLPAVFNSFDMDDYSPLTKALEVGSDRLCELLIPFCDLTTPDRRGRIPLLMILQSRTSLGAVAISALDAVGGWDGPKLVHWLVANRVNPNVVVLLPDDFRLTSSPSSRYTTSLLGLLCSRLDISRTRALLKHHPIIDVNFAGEGGLPPLMVACSHALESHPGAKRKELVELLLAHPEIDVNRQDDAGYTPLMMACEALNGGGSPVELRKEVVALLLAVRGIEVDIEDHRGYSVFVYAACQPVREERKHAIEHIPPRSPIDGFGPLELVQLLLNHPDIQVNSQNNNGSTALMLACDGRYVDRQVARGFFNFLISETSPSSSFDEENESRDLLFELCQLQSKDLADDSRLD